MFLSFMLHWRKAITLGIIKCRVYTVESSSALVCKALEMVNDMKQWKTESKPEHS